MDGQTVSYTYDEAGQLTSETRGGVATAYTYDGNFNRLTKAVGGSVVETYAYSDDDRLLSVTSSAGVRSFDYDNAGRTTAERWQGAVVKTYSWNADDRLVTATGAFGSRSYGYSFSGARASETGGQGRSWLRRGTGVTSPVLRDGVSRYSPGSSVRPLAGGDSAFQHGGWKSFEAQTGPTGTVSGTKEYDAFGAQLGSTGAWQGGLAHGGGFGYQSDDTGLQLLGHRYYDPSTGRFLTRDPIKDGPNWYAYCLNDPVNHTDPTGLSFSIGGFEFTAQVWADGLGTSAKALAGMLTDSVTDAPLWFLLRKLQIYDLRNPFNDAFGGEAGYGESKIFWMIGLAAASGAAGAAGAAGRGLRGACFTAGTPIVMADGSTKPIEEVRPGDRVLSQPQEGGDPVVSTVDRTFERKAEKTLVLTFSDGSTVETTDEHPFYVPGKGWTAAKALRAGTAVESLSGPGLESESASRIVSVRAVERQARVYNFEVAGTHTYYVATGDSAVWVHNACSKPTISQVKRGLREVHEQVGKIDGSGRGTGKWGSPTRSDGDRGYRLDPPHPGRPPGDPEAGWHFNWWDWSGGKKGSGGRWGAVPIE